MSKWNLIINVGRCENCYNCVIAERDEHVGNDFPGYAAPAAAVGTARSASCAACRAARPWWRPPICR